MVPILFLVIFLAGNASASSIANQYIESVLNTVLRNEIRSLNLDPAQIPDFVTDFEGKVANIGKVKGKAKFSNGVLTGLSEGRVTECQGPYYSFGARNINCSINFVDLKFEYDGKLNDGEMPEENFKGNADVKDTTVSIEITSLLPNSPSALKNFLFEQISRVETKFTGLGPLNRFIKFLEDGFRGHVQAEIFNSMSQRYRYALNRAVAMIPMPN